MGCLTPIFGDTKQAKKECKGRSNDQQQVIHYFLDERGCLSKGISDAEFDANKERQIAALNLRNKALGKLGLDEDQVKEVDPIMLIGPVHKDNENYKRIGTDNIGRYSKYQITYIFCSATQVYVYQYTINLTSSSRKERAEEYFYKDITSFTTVDDEDDLPAVGAGCLKNSTGSTVKVKTSEFKISVPGDAFLCSMIPNDETEGKIQALKAKLREKKNS